jgi:competence ComEA-like helix-hairpin-helix protein
MIELSRDEKRLVLFLCFFLLAGAALNLVRAAFPGLAKFMGYNDEKEEVIFKNMSPADSVELAFLIERSREGVEREPVQFPLDLNTAGPGELQLLPGIGAVKAAEIVKLRDSLGVFSNVDELVGVKGIGPKTLEKLRPYVVVR